MVCSTSFQPVPIERTATSATSTLTITNAIRIRALATGRPVDRKRVMIRIGPNSPTAPAPSR